MYRVITAATIVAAVAGAGCTSTAPTYYPATQSQVVVQQQPVYAAPAPVYVQPSPVIVQRQVYRPGPVVVQQRIVRAAPDCRTVVRRDERPNGNVVTSRTRTC
jgi:hypothetical protein